MKKFKAILALLLIAALSVSLFTACANQSNDNSATGNDYDTSAGNSSNGADTGDHDAALDPDDIVDIQIYVVQFTNTVEEYARVQTAINAITESEIGVRVELQIFEFGDYPTQLGLAMSSGENIDLAYMSFGASAYSSLYSSGQLMDIGDLLIQYAPELMETMGPYAYSYAIGDGIYALPPYRAYNSECYLLMRTDMLEEMSMLEFAKNMTTWAEVEELFEKVKNDYPEMFAICTGNCQDLILGGKTFADSEPYDRLGDALYLIYTDQENNKVESYVEQDAYLEQVQRTARWMDAGYIWPDALFSDEMGDNIIRQGVAFSEFMPSEIGVETAKTQATGYDITAVRINTMAVTSANVQKFGICVPITADEPEAAVRFLNMMYTDSRIITLLTYGEQGKDYVITGSGEAAYPEGVESSTVGYHSHDFLVGNQFLIAPWDGMGSNLRELAAAFFAQAPTSKYLGFTFDSLDMDNLLAGLNNVTEEYSKTINSGGYTEERYESYLDKLYKTGLQEYLDSYQTQLDAWLVNK